MCVLCALNVNVCALISQAIACRRDLEPLEKDRYPSGLIDAKAMIRFSCDELTHI